MRIPRRQIIRYGLLGVGATLPVLGRIPKALANTPPKGGVYDTIILGAGISGLTAAQLLRAKNRSVLVLEGSDRIGGRILTNRTLIGGPLELGAEFVHRAPGTVPLWNDINKLGLKTQELSKVHGSMMYYKPWGVGAQSTVGAALKWSPFKAVQVLDEIAAYKGSEMTPEQYLANKGYTSKEDQDFVGMILTGHLPARMNDLSMRGYISDRIPEQLAELGEYYITGGYDTLVNGMAKGVDIQRNQNVESIEQNSEGVVVRTRGGATFRAKTVICTFSVGMLKSGKVEFKPGLNSQKKEALKSIKMGYLGKFSVQFNERFWPTDMPMLNRPDRGRRVSRTIFQVNAGQPNKPAVLSALVHGEDGERTKNWTDHQMLAAFCKDLDEAFPFAAPTSRFLAGDAQGNFIYARKQWLLDPFAMGGTSYLTVEGNSSLDITQVRPALADADMAPIFFGGEAASIGTQPSSVHGAHCAGLQAAIQANAYLSSGTKLKNSEMLALLKG